MLKWKEILKQKVLHDTKGSFYIGNGSPLSKNMEVVNTK